VNGSILREIGVCGTKIVPNLEKRTAKCWDEVSAVSVDSRRSPSTIRRMEGNWNLADKAFQPRLTGRPAEISEPVKLRAVGSRGTMPICEVA